MNELEMKSSSQWKVHFRYSLPFYYVIIQSLEYVNVVLIDWLVIVIIRVTT